MAYRRYSKGRIMYQTDRSGLGVTSGLVENACSGCPSAARQSAGELLRIISCARHQCAAERLHRVHRPSRDGLEQGL
eukprot:6591765-Pyramimonas_sp.AAC.1